MGGLVFLLGIVLLVVIISRPPGKSLFSTTITVITGILFLIFAAWNYFSCNEGSGRRCRAGRAGCWLLDIDYDFCRYWYGN
jgi:energy-coupling factor transporter transmembrane protein EcfT